jgi:glycogen debranching enzyme
MNSDGFNWAVELLHKALTPAGFVASLTDENNYRRVWTRDGVITSLAALMTEDEKLHRGVESTLETIANHQGPHGEIPSNVSADGLVSYGGLVGRVDAPLWYIIGVCAYVKRSGKRSLAERHREPMERALFISACWEFNNRGLIYAPVSSDWADEFILSGYTLLVQVLYYQALKGFGTLFRSVEHIEKAENLKKLIEINYWVSEDGSKADLYHPNAYRQFLNEKGRKHYWLASFSPTGYNDLFDGLANSLVLLSGIGNQEKDEKLVNFVEKCYQDSDFRFLPAFYPPVKPGDGNWELLKRNFRYKFSNYPWAYHNGGFWPMVAGFWTAGLVRSGKKKIAASSYEVISNNNYHDKNGEEWGFFEWHHGKTVEPGGTRYTVWSAAGEIIAERAVHGGMLPF